MHFIIRGHAYHSRLIAHVLCCSDSQNSCCTCVVSSKTHYFGVSNTHQSTFLKSSSNIVISWVNTGLLSLCFSWCMKKTLLKLFTCYNHPAEFATKYPEMLSKLCIKYHEEMLGRKSRQTTWNGWGSENVGSHWHKQRRRNDTRRSSYTRLFLHCS